MRHRTVAVQVALSRSRLVWAFVLFGMMTGWRVGELPALRRDDVDLKNGTAITRHADSKGKRDDKVPLHSVVVQHLERIVSFNSLVLPRSHHRTTLWMEFEQIQKAAGIQLPCHESH